MATEPAGATRRKRRTASQIALLGGPKSAEASLLVDHILQDHVQPRWLASLAKEGAKQPPRPTSVQRMRRVVGALLADLLDLEAHVKPGAEVPAGLRGVSPKDFNLKAQGFARSIFLEGTYHMVAAGLLKVTKGAPKWQPVFDEFASSTMVTSPTSPGTRAAGITRCPGGTATRVEVPNGAGQSLRSTVREWMKSIYGLLISPCSTLC